MARTQQITAIAALLLAFLPARGFAHYAFVWANEPTSTSYVPLTTNSHNSTGAINTIRRISRGVYRVLMPDVQPNKAWGNVQVTAYGTGPNFCNAGAANWTSPDDLTLDVYCFDGSRNPADSQFTALYHDDEDALDGGDLAYTRADRPSATSAYYGTARFSYNSEWADRATSVVIDPDLASDFPSYRVLFRGWENSRLNPVTGGQDTAPGILHLTTYDPGPNRCRVLTQNYTGEGLDVRVMCSAPTRFSLAVFRDRVAGSSRTVGTYVNVGLGLEPVRLGWYNPIGPLNFRPDVTQLALGRYRVEFLRVADSYTESTVQVTSQGSFLGIAATCKVLYWYRRGDNINVFVDCYSLDSSLPANSGFFLSFVTEDSY